MQAGLRGLCLGDSEEPRGAAPIPRSRREAGGDLQHALSRRLRADFRGDRQHLEQQPPGAAGRSPADRHHREIEQPDRDDLAIAQLARERQDLLVERLGGIEARPRSRCNCASALSAAASSRLLPSSRARRKRFLEMAARRESRSPCPSDAMPERAGARRRSCRRSRDLARNGEALLRDIPRASA